MTLHPCASFIYVPTNTPLLLQFGALCCSLIKGLCVVISLHRKNCIICGKKQQHSISVTPIIKTSWYTFWLFRYIVVKNIKTKETVNKIRKQVKRQRVGRQRNQSKKRLVSGTENMNGFEQLEKTSISAVVILRRSWTIYTEKNWLFLVKIWAEYTFSLDMETA